MLPFDTSILRLRSVTTGSASEAQGAIQHDNEESVIVTDAETSSA